MNSRTRKAVILFSSLLLIAGAQGAAFAAKPKAAGKNPCKELGAADMNAYCQKKLPNSKADLKDKKNPQGWQCVEKEAAKGKTPATAAVVMDEVCKQQFGAAAKAELGKAKDPYSWRCVQCTK